MSLRRIYVVRHEIAEDRADSDFDRALTGEGRQRARRSGRGLAGLGVKVDLLASSPLVRAVETADELAPGLEPSRREVWDELACGVDEIALTARLDGLGASTDVMLVGHEPDLGELIAYWLTGRKSGLHVHVRKGSVTCLQAGALPPDGRATLEWSLTAKQLGRMAG